MSGIILSASAQGAWAHSHGWEKKKRRFPLKTLSITLMYRPANDEQNLYIEFYVKVYVSGAYYSYDAHHMFPAFTVLFSEIFFLVWVMTVSNV